MWEWLTSSAAGNFGQMLGAILTGGSFFLGFYILLRDRRLARLAQGQRVIAWIRPKDTDQSVQVLTIRNASDMPILDAMVVMYCSPSRRLRIHLRNLLGKKRQPFTLEHAEYIHIARAPTVLYPRRQHTEEIDISPFTTPSDLFDMLRFYDAMGEPMTKSPNSKFRGERFYRRHMGRIVSIIGRQIDYLEAQQAARQRAELREQLGFPDDETLDAFYRIAKRHPHLDTATANNILASDGRDAKDLTMLIENNRRKAHSKGKANEQNRQMDEAQRLAPIDGKDSQ
jgi:hypothetical protein